MKKKLLRLMLSILILITIAIGTGFTYLRRMPAPDVAINTMVVFYDRHGKPFLEEVIPNRRKFAQLHEISPYVIDGFVATEDRNFWNHNGFYYPSIVRSVIANLRAGSSVQGGSTITQQYARNLMVDFERSVERKLREAAYTIRLEDSYNKEEILEGYLNTINFGHGIYGIQDASLFYFGINASELNLAQASILVGIPKGPSIYSPIGNYDNARDRQKVVLEAMVETEKITEFQKQQALNTELVFIGKRPVDEGINYYFIDAVLREVDTLLTENLSEFDFLRIHTTLDPRIQEAINQSVAENIEDDSDLQSVVIVMEPETGNVLGLSGGSNYSTSQFNRALFSERQIGSLMKPLLYMAALEYGVMPSQAMMSTPTTFYYNDGIAYKPGNYNENYAFADISMANALAVSDNIFAVKMHDFLGFDMLPEIAQRFGISADIEQVPSAALGVSNINMMEMTEAYGILANEGRRVEHRFVTMIKDAEDVIIDNRPIQEDVVQVFSTTDTFILNEMMSGMFNLANNNHLSITGLSILDRLTHRYAGKTGSTDTDSWMIGFSPDILTTVWIGYDDNVKIKESAAIAKYIWADVMEEAHQQGSRWFREPGNVVVVPVDARNGEVVDITNPRKVNLYFQIDNQPKPRKQQNYVERAHSILDILDNSDY